MAKGRKYKLQLVDVSRLEEVASFRLKWWYAAIVIILLLVFSVLVGTFIVLSTPVREMLPGYMKDDEREDMVDAMLRIDSLRNIADANDAYLANLQSVLNTDRTDYIIERDENIFEQSESPSFIGASKREMNFVNDMRTRDRFNLSALTETPRGMTFSPLSPSATVIAESRDSTALVLAISPGVPIMSVAEGSVIESISQSGANKNRYTVIIQHPNGYLSRYSGLPVPLVRKGADVAASQPLAVTDGSHSVITIELWQDGIRLIPAHYLDL